MAKDEAGWVNIMASLISLKVGDLIRFSGAYYELEPDGKLCWIISKLWRDGLVVQIVDRRTWIMSEGKQYSIDFDSNCEIDIISRIGEKNEKR